MGLVYQFFKYNVRFISHLYFRNVVVNGLENVPNDKPVLLLPNHPNSFLDPALVAAILNRSTHFLARGDLFRKPVAAWFLRSFNIIPIYRESEGREHVSRNHETHDSCQKIFDRGGMVLVFPEGLTKNNWEIRELKKGPFRIAMNAWKSETASKNLVIVPIGLTYEHFSGAGNTILIQFGEPYTESDFEAHPLEAVKVKEFFKRFTESVHNLAVIHPDLTTEHPHYPRFRSILQKINSYRFNLAEFLAKARKLEGSHIHIKQESWVHKTLIFLPLYYFVLWLTPRIIHDDTFHDAIRFALFLMLWPIYLFGFGLLIHLSVSLLS